MAKLHRLYEAKLASLRAAHEESRSKIILSAMVRNRRGVDVNFLMESAAARRDADLRSKRVYDQVAGSEGFRAMLDHITAAMPDRNPSLDDDGLHTADNDNDDNIRNRKIAGMAARTNGEPSNDTDEAKMQRSYNLMHSNLSHPSRMSDVEDSDEELMVGTEGRAGLGGGEGGGRRREG